MAFSTTQLEMNADACNEFKKIDSQLNDYYQKVLASYSSDKNFVEKFKNAQRAWLQFRDAHIQALYPAEDKTAYGSIFPMCNCTVLANLTSERVKQIKTWLDGVEEGDVCMGSVKIKTALNLRQE